MEKSRPYIILSAAISIDGKISTKKRDSQLSSKLDLKRLHKLRSKVDAILIGKNTLDRDNPLLTVRFVNGKNPIRIILDSKGTISKNSQIIQTSHKISTIIAISKSIPKKNLLKLQRFPIETIQTGQSFVSLKPLLKKLVKKNIRTLLVEGGGTVNWQFVKENLFDEIIITVTPCIIGGTNSIALVQGRGFSYISQSPKLRLKSTSRLGNDLILHYVKL